MNSTDSSVPKKPAPRRPQVRSARRRARELVVQGLYQWRVAGQDAAAIEHFLSTDPEYSRADRPLFVALLNGTLDDAPTLIAALTPFLDRRFEELSPVEAGILLLAAHELAAHRETPYRVIINEAIELAKTFGGTDGHKYVNGVLDRLAAELRGDEIRAATR